jgi:hypothetical protein
MSLNKFFTLLFFLSAFGCQQQPVDESKPSDNRDEVTEIVEEPIKEEAPDYKCSRIRITLHDDSNPTSQSYINYGPFSPEIIFETKSEKIIEKFEQMTSDAERTGYCCCPDHNYLIAFFDGKVNYKEYFVDTLEFADKVRIFQISYQYSYIVDKKTWTEFLDMLDQISFNEYFLTDLEIARGLYALAEENDLQIISSNRFSKEWMHFDGDFKIKVGAVGQHLDEAKVYENIKKAYPDDIFKIETISHYKMGGTYDGKDSYSELILQIFCNKGFYEKFNIYTPKSYFEEAKAEFYVLGSRGDLNKLDRIAKEKN